jgi:hypothetical protein
MGLNDEYSRDAYLPEEAGRCDDEDDNEPLPLHPEDWQDWYSEELLDMWFSLRALAEAMFEDRNVLRHATYHRWVEFVMHPEDWGLACTAPQAGTLTADLWAVVSSSELMREATYEQFRNFVSHYS